MILEVSWDGLWTFLLGSHGFMVMTRGSCVKLPLGPDYTMDHGRWPSPMVWLHGPASIVRFFFKKKTIYKAFGPLTRCNQDVDQEGWPCTKKWMWWFFLNIWPRRAVLKENLKLDHSLVFIFFSPKKKTYKKHCYNNISLPWAPTFFYKNTFCLSHCKTRWTMSVDNVGLKTFFGGPLIPRLLWLFFPWCKPKWSWNDLNNQSHIFTRPWDDFIVHDVKASLHLKAW